MQQFQICNWICWVNNYYLQGSKDQQRNYLFYFGLASQNLLVINFQCIKLLWNQVLIHLWNFNCSLFLFCRIHLFPRQMCIVSSKNHIYLLILIFRWISISVDLFRLLDYLFLTVLFKELFNRRGEVLNICSRMHF